MIAGLSQNTCLAPSAPISASPHLKRTYEKDPGSCGGVSCPFLFGSGGMEWADLCIDKGAGVIVARKGDE